MSYVHEDGPTEAHQENSRARPSRFVPEEEVVELTERPSKQATAPSPTIAAGPAKESVRWVAEPQDLKFMRVQASLVRMDFVC